MGKNLDLAYLAGFFDGEGSIMIEKRLSKATGRMNFRKLRLSVSQQEPKPLQIYKAVFGGSLTFSKSTMMWIWVVSDRNAAIVLEALRPYLFVKKEEADIALAHREYLLSLPGTGRSKIFTAEYDSKLEEFHTNLLAVINTRKEILGEKI